MRNINTKIDRVSEGRVFFSILMEHGKITTSASIKVKEIITSNKPTSGISRVKKIREIESVTDMCKATQLALHDHELHAVRQSINSKLLNHE